MLSPTDQELLIALRRGGYSKGNPAFPRELLNADWQESDAAFRRLREARLVKVVPDDAKPGSPCCRLTDQGAAQADVLIGERDKDSHVQIIGPTPPKIARDINWTKWGAVGALLAIPTMIALWWFN